MLSWISAYYHKFVEYVFEAPIIVGAVFAIAAASLVAIFNQDRNTYMRSIVTSAIVGAIVFTAIYFILIVIYKP